ncbi:hypothetical protein ES705_39445 [subsurface metagenome]
MWRDAPSAHQDGPILDGEGWYVHRHVHVHVHGHVDVIWGRKDMGWGSEVATDIEPGSRKGVKAV